MATETARKRRWGWKVGVALVAMLAVVFCTYGGWRWRLHRQVEAELARWEAAGYPTTYEELGARYPEPEGANVAEIYLEAARVYVADEDADKLLPIVGEAELPPPGTPWPDEMRVGVEAYLQRNDAALRVALSNTEPIAGKYPIGLEDGVMAVLPHLGYTRNLGRLLSTTAEYRSRSGDAMAAFEAVQGLGFLAESMRDEPLAITQMVRASIIRWMIERIESLVTIGGLQNEDLVAIAQQLDAIDLRGGVKRSLWDQGVLFEMVWVEEVMKSRANTLRVIASGAIDRERVTFLRELRELLELQESRDTTLTARDFHPTPDFVHADILYESAQGAVQFLSTVEVQRDVAVAGIAVARFHRMERRLPESLNELVPQYLESVIRDPFSGAPLRYRVEPDGFIVYSVGANGVDDGGRNHDQVGEFAHDGTDIAFTVGPVQERLWPLPPKEKLPDAIDNPYFTAP